MTRWGKKFGAFYKLDDARNLKMNKNVANGQRHFFLHVKCRRAAWVRAQISLNSFNYLHIYFASTFLSLFKLQTALWLAAHNHLSCNPKPKIIINNMVRMRSFISSNFVFCRNTASNSLILNRMFSLKIRQQMEHDEVEFCEKSISSKVKTSLISIRPMSKCKTIYFRTREMPFFDCHGSFISANDKVYLLLVSHTIKQYLHFCPCCCLNQSGPTVSSSTIIDQVSGDIFNKSNVPTPNYYIPLAACIVFSAHF